MVPGGAVVKICLPETAGDTEMPGDPWVEEAIPWRRNGSPRWASCWDPWTRRGALWVTVRKGHKKSDMIEHYRT